jgi:cyclic pyranopterin phosphate synthase
MGLLSDGFGRQFSYLRLSVTEVCNYRCTYCLPDGYRKTRPHDFLRVDEVARLARVAVRAGLSKIRLTGGEPSARGDLAGLIAAVSDAGAGKVALTTNGWSLARDLARWTDAGLTHLNVSVDSLDPAVFAAVTGHDRLAGTLAGVDAALASPLASVKINAVLMRETLGEDLAGLSAFAAFLRDRPTSVRFIELMRTGDNAAFHAAQHVSGHAVRLWLATHGWRERPRGSDDGPAVEFEHADHAGRFGLIAPYAAGFCDSCNRLRVTARGKLRLCLFGDGGVDLRPLLQDDGDQEAALALLVQSLRGKARGHQLAQALTGATGNLSEVGG